MIKTHIYIQNSTNHYNNNNNSNNNQHEEIPLCLNLENKERINGDTVITPPFHEYVSASTYRILSQNASAALESSSCIKVYNRTIIKDEHHDGDRQQAPVVIYVHQRELAHASSQQYNNSQGGVILASDSATTCHIVAFKSVSFVDSNRLIKNENVLGSLCHLDSAENVWTCLENIIRHHVQYHDVVGPPCTRKDGTVVMDDCISSSSSKRRIVQMEVHMIGGYDDDQNTSSEITHELISSLVKLALEWRDVLKMTLGTCIVGRLNTEIKHVTQTSRGGGGGTIRTSSFSSPIVRGMVMDVRSSWGRIHLLTQHVDRSLVGPEPILRHARLWSSAPEAKDIMVVHDYDQERVIVRPFTFHAFHGMENLLKLPDHLLLQCTSTSPECEADDFCNGIREVCRYLMKTRVEDVFGPENCRKSLVFNYEYKEEEGCVWKKDVMSTNL